MLRMVPPGLNAEYLIIYVKLVTVHPTDRSPDRPPVGARSRLNKH
jgi:hypothetical protein